MDDCIIKTGTIVKMRLNGEPVMILTREVFFAEEPEKKRIYYGVRAANFECYRVSDFELCSCEDQTG